MTFAISPHYTTDHFPHGPREVDQKILVFLDRVEGWQLGVADYLVKNQVGYRGFALLLIVVSYFEMIGRYSAYPKMRSKK